MNETLRITCTSLLPPGPAWKPLQAVRALEFGEYGDWPRALTSHEGLLLFVIVLQDLVGLDAQAGLHEMSEADVRALLAPALDLIEGHARGDLLVAWTQWQPQSAISSAKTKAGW